MRLSAHASQSRNPHHPVQMLGHDLHAQHLDFRRELGDPPEVRLNRPSEFGQDDGRFRFVRPPEDWPRAIVEHERDQIGAGAAIIPIVAPSRHAVNDGAHPDPGIGIQMPAGTFWLSRFIAPPVIFHESTRHPFRPRPFSNTPASQALRLDNYSTGHTPSCHHHKSLQRPE